jgi:hypothetical protein
MINDDLAARLSAFGADHGCVGALDGVGQHVEVRDEEGVAGEALLDCVQELERDLTA